MTNKRAHQLERIVRINFKDFNQIIYPKYVGIELLEKITKLMINRIQLEHHIGNITISELHFMIRCARRYYSYYKTLIDKNFD